MMKAGMLAMRLPCLARPKTPCPEEGLKDVKHATDAPSSHERRARKAESEAPMASEISISKVRGRCSNAVAAAVRFHHRDLLEDYTVFNNKVLGEGCSGKVVAARNLTTGRTCAVKRIQKTSLTNPRMLQQLVAEVEICLTLDHPNIVRLDDVYDTDHEVAIVTELLEGGELYGRLHEAKIFSEALTAETTRQLLRAVGYMHSHDVVHRDLKLENVMYESSAPDAPLKVIDFGFAKVWDSNKLMQASCGSVAYVSPDVLCGQGYTSQCDLWSIGVIVFMLLSGYPPFHGTEDAMRQGIVKATADWNHPRRWGKVSRDAIDFVKSLLVRDPAERLDAQAALNHRWLMTSACNNKPTLPSAAVRSLDSYARAPYLRRAVLQLVARELSPADVADLRQTFLELSRNEHGTVRLSELKAAIRGNEPADSQNPDEDPKTPARTLRRAKTEKLAEVFHAMDVNGDDQVYYSDFLAATMSNELQLREEHIRAAFRRLDADNSGAISAEDIESSIGDAFDSFESDDLVRDAGFCPSAGIDYEGFVGLLGHTQPIQSARKPSHFRQRCN